jgi:hypothetical protein
MAAWKPILGGSVGYKAGNFSKDAAIPLNGSANETSKIPKTDGAKPTPSNYIGAFLGKFFHSHHDTAQHLEKDADVGASDAVSNTNSMELTLEGDPGIEPGSLVKLSYKDPSTSQPMEADGLWLVEYVFHELHVTSRGRTKLKLSRTSTSTVGNTKISGTDAPTAGSGSLSATNGAYSSGGRVVTASATV